METIITDTRLILEDEAVAGLRADLIRFRFLRRTLLAQQVVVAGRPVLA